MVILSFLEYEVSFFFVLFDFFEPALKETIYNDLSTNTYVSTQQKILKAKNNTSPKNSVYLLSFCWRVTVSKQIVSLLIMDNGRLSYISGNIHNTINR